MSALEQLIRKYADEPTKSIIRPALGLSFNSLGKVCSIISSFFRLVDKVPFTRRTLRNICGKINHEQAEDDVRKTLEVFADIVGGDPGFTYRILADSTSKVNNLMWTNGMEAADCSIWAQKTNIPKFVCIFLSKEL